MRLCVPRSLAAVLLVGAIGCGGGTSESPENGGNGEGSTATPSNVSLNKDDYPVFPDADNGADPGVTAEQGGKGFTGEGWETNTDYELIGDPRAIKGGTYREYQPDFPSTLRIEGPESNSVFNSMVAAAVYETLLYLHPATLDYIPGLATHWQISSDKLTYRFRLDPNARWSDGQPVIADDVVATWSFLMDKGLQAPSTAFVFGKLDKPVAESKYIVRVKAKTLNWRNFLYLSQAMPILPAHVLKNVDGAAYVRDYNFKLLPGTGPYEVREADVEKGKSVGLHRRSGYWGEKIRRSVGVNNFDNIREIVVRDRKLAFEMFKKGDLDFHPPNPEEWVEELDKLDRVQRGLIQRRKVYNEKPLGITGLAINMRRPPLNDVRVRAALAHLMNRPLMIEKLFHNEYVAIDSFHARMVYENPSNPKMDYNPQKALELLAEAGWKERDAQGRLTKNGQPLAIELLYFAKPYEAALTTYQEDLRRVGISLNLRFLTPETLYTLTGQRKFELALVRYTGLLFPNPETSWASALADQNHTNNLSGFKNNRVDELLPVYDKEFDQNKRVAIVQEIDGIATNAHPYVLMWETPYVRVAYWNKFGMPEGSLTRFGDFYDIPTLWWIDPQKEAALRKTMGDNSARLPVGEVDVRYWQEYAKKRPVHESEGFTGNRQ